MTKLAMQAIPSKSVAVMASDVSDPKTRDLLSVLAVWLLLAVTLIFLALPNTSAPGLYYDEAQCAGLARDFLTGHPRLHMPGCEVISLWGRPFPVFAQVYIGAVKSWLLLPGFAVFGASQAVLRMTALGWALVALLLFMLWTWRWLGRDTALVAGVLLALDPTFFFVSVLDWGLVLPSFLCRFACFYFALRWRQGRNEPSIGDQKDQGKTTGYRSLIDAFLAGLFAGLGFFNKIDFAVLLAGVLLALLCCNARPFWEYFVLGRSAASHPQWIRLGPPLALACLGFLLSAGPMLAHIPKILTLDKPGGEPGEVSDKFNALLWVYDGSYFHRLMDAGGRFDKMSLTRADVFAPVGIGLILAAACLIGTERFRKVFTDPLPSLASFYRSSGGAAAFLLFVILFITAGIFLLPGAVRIHHMVLVYPFPHLVVALAVTRLWQRGRREEPGPPARSVFPQSSFARPLPWLVGCLFVLLLSLQLLALCQTQQLIRQTGGRGWWSNALSAFALQMKDRSDLTIVSLDWGFSEQLAFLTDGPTLTEPFWREDTSVSMSTNCIYLTHPPEYRLFEFEPSYLETARRSGLEVVDYQPWNDAQGHAAFNSFRLRRK
ncbi:MAG: ArnT family glycosyltransferase [Limisphaerales bacterium]